MERLFRSISVKQLNTGVASPGRVFNVYTKVKMTFRLRLVINPSFYFAVKAMIETLRKAICQLFFSDTDMQIVTCNA